jgi:hypothetical protein
MLSKSLISSDKNHRWRKCELSIRMNDASAGLNCVNLILQTNRSSLLVARQASSFYFPKDL